jgi:hypothetical protein
MSRRILNRPTRFAGQSEDLIRTFSLHLWREEGETKPPRDAALLIVDDRRGWWRWLQLPVLLGLFGGAVLAGGAEAPLIHIPIVGSVSYLRHPRYFSSCSIGEMVILTAAGLSVLFALLKRFKMLWLTGGVALAQLIATIAIFEHDAAAVVAKADQPDLVDPVLMWAGSALEHAHFEWGIAIVAAGAMMVLVAAAWGRGGVSKG